MMYKMHPLHADQLEVATRKQLDIEQYHCTTKRKTSWIKVVEFNLFQRTRRIFCVSSTKQRRLLVQDAKQKLCAFFLTTVKLDAIALDVYKDQYAFQ